MHLLFISLNLLSKSTVAGSIDKRPNFLPEQYTNGYLYYQRIFFTFPSFIGEKNAILILLHFFFPGLLS